MKRQSKGQSSISEYFKKCKTDSSQSTDSVVIGAKDSSTSATANDNIPSCPWTIYKIDNENLESEENIQNIEELCEVLDRLLTRAPLEKRRAPLEKRRAPLKKRRAPLKKRRAPLEKRTVTHDICGSFKLLHYVFLDTKDENKVAKQLKRQRGTGGKDTTPLPGNRTSGNILVYCRLHYSETKCKKIPEVFLLCQGNIFSSIKGLIDPSFRSAIARTFVDGREIKKYETKNIAGPALTSEFTFKNYTNISLTSVSTFTDVYVSFIAGLINGNSELYEIVHDSKVDIEGEQIALTVGQNFVRIEKKLSYKTSAEVCELFARTQCNNQLDDSIPILDALEFVQRIPFKKDKYCARKFNKLSIDVLSGEAFNSDFYLSDSVSQHWLNSSELTLFDCKDTNGPYEIWNWSSAPSLIEVIERLKKKYKTADTIRHNLQKKIIKLSYSSPFTETKNPRPLQNFVHGCLDTEDGLFVMIEKKWFKVSSDLCQIIDSRFCECILKYTVLEDENIKRLIKYPWCKTQKIFSVLDFREFVEVSEDSAEKIFAI